MKQLEYIYQMTQGHVPSVDQQLGILQPMNPVVDRIIPSDYFDPVTNMQPYGLSPALGGIQDVLQVLQVTDLLFGK